MGGSLAAPFSAPVMSQDATSDISHRFQWFSPTQGQVVHVFLPNPPLSHKNIAILVIPFDLHA